MATTSARAAASTLLRPLLTDRHRPGRVLGVHTSAVYLDLGGDLVALEASDALRLPCSVVLPVPAAARPFAALRPGDRAGVALGRVSAGGLDVDVVRWWRPRGVRTVDEYDAAQVARLAASIPPPSPGIADRIADLAGPHASETELFAASSRLLGLGPGLTPEGDDVMAGLLVALHSRPATRRLAGALAGWIGTQAAARTTSLSATLLRHAAAGHAIPRLLDVIDALDAHDADDAHDAGIGLDTRTRSGAAGDLQHTVVRLLAVGHTSGAALAHGVLAATALHPRTSVRSEVT